MVRRKNDNPLIRASKYESSINFRGTLFVNNQNQRTRAYDYEFLFNINLFKHEIQHNRKDIHMRRESTYCKTKARESLI